MKVKPNAKRDAAKQLFDQGFSYKEIAEKTDTPLNTIHTWSARYWKKTAKSTATGVGSGPPGNQNAIKHGYRSKIIPPDIQDLIEEIKSLNEMDILWDSICYQFAAIIRAQNLMYVKDANDKIEELTSETNGESIQSRSYEIQQAWERQSSFLIAQSKAISSLSTAISQYTRLCDKGLTSETHRQNLELIKAKVQALKSNQDVGEAQLAKLDELLKGVKDIAKEKTDGSNSEAS